MKFAVGVDPPNFFFLSNMPFLVFCSWKDWSLAFGTGVGHTDGGWQSAGGLLASCYS